MLVLYVKSMINILKFFYQKIDMFIVSDEKMGKRIIFNAIFSFIKHEEFVFVIFFLKGSCEKCRNRSFIIYIAHCDRIVRILEFESRIYLFCVYSNSLIICNSLPKSLIFIHITNFV